MNRQPWVEMRASIGMLQAWEKTARHEMRVRGKVTSVAHDPCGHTDLLQLIHHVESVALARPRGNDRIKLILVIPACQWRGKPLVSVEPRLAEHAHKACHSLLDRTAIVIQRSSPRHG